MSAQFVFIIASLFVNYKVEKLWGVDGFASYNIIKKLGTFVVFILVLGTGIGIPRYISFIKNKKEKGGVEYLLAGVLLYLSTFTLFIIFLYFFPELFTTVLESNFKKESLLFILALYIFSQGFFVLISSYLRGVLKFSTLCFLNIFILSFIPVVFLFFSKDILNYFWFISIINSGLLTFLIVSSIYKNRSYSIKILKFKSKQLLNYGSPRIIADMSLFSLDFLPIYLLSAFVSLPESGYLSLSLLFFKLATMPFELIGSLLIPVLGKTFKNSSKMVFVKKINNLIAISLLFSVLFSIILWFISPYLISNFFPSMQQSIIGTQFIIMSVPFYVVFLLVKNILDIVSVKAYNSWLLTAGIFILLLVLSYGIYKEDWFYFRSLPVIVAYVFLGISSSLVWIKVKNKM